MNPNSSNFQTIRWVKMTTLEFLISVTVLSLSQHFVDRKGKDNFYLTTFSQNSYFPDHLNFHNFSLASNLPNISKTIGTFIKGVLPRTG